MTGTMLAQTPAGQGAPPAGGGGATQGGTPGGGGPGGGANVPGGGIPGGGNNTGRPGQQSPFPDNRQQQQTPFPTEMPRPIMISGKVMLDDGVPPPEPVVIERVCNGNPRPEGYTDSKGRFSFQLGQNQHMMADASVGNNDPFGGGPNMSGMGRNDPMGRGGISERDLMGCEIRASLPGYRSESINLAGRRSMDNPDVGTIVLKRLANVEGRTFSITSAAAPKDAKKAYEKARDLEKKKKLAEAQKEYEKAVAAYPKYANAWFDLGFLHERQNHADEAKKAYQEAINADVKLVKPYVQLSFLAAQEKDWKGCAELSEKALKLNPFDFPQVYFYSAVANYNLQNFEAAEKSARDGVKADGDKRIPKLRQLLGMVLAQKNDVSGAMEQIKGYMSMLPANSPEIGVAKNQISQLEKMAQNQGQATPRAADGQQQQ